MRIAIGITQPLRAEFTLRCDDEKVHPISIKLERLGNFCFYCGILNHDDTECLRKVEDGTMGVLAKEIQRARNLATIHRRESPKKWGFGNVLAYPHKFFTPSPSIVSNSDD